MMVQQAHNAYILMVYTLLNQTRTNSQPACSCIEILFWFSAARNTQNNCRRHDFYYILIFGSSIGEFINHKTIYRSVYSSSLWVLLGIIWIVIINKWNVCVRCSFVCCMPHRGIGYSHRSHHVCVCGVCVPMSGMCRAGQNQTMYLNHIPNQIITMVGARLCSV